MPVKVTVEPSDADRLVGVIVVADWTALALVPLAAVVPPTVGLKINTDFA